MVRVHLSPSNKWGCSSVGRAPALQAGGQEFESLHLHSSVADESVAVMPAHKHKEGVCCNDCYTVRKENVP